MQKSISRKKLLILASIAALLVVGVPVTRAVLNVGQVNVVVTFVNPPLSPSGATVGGTKCSGAGATITCTGSFTLGAANSVVIGVTNPASVAQTVSTSTSAPSGCMLTVVEGSATVPALSSGSVSVSFSVGSAMTAGTQCSLTIALNQA